MKKYWLIFKNTIQQNLTYRVDVFALLFSEGLSLLFLSYLWLSIYQGGGQLGTYTLKGLIIYYLLTKFINLTVKATDIARITGDPIFEGHFTNYLIRPLNFSLHIFFINLGVVFYKFLIYILIFLLAFSFVFSFSDINFNANILYFFIFICLAIIINFLIFYMVGISTFFLGFIAGFNFTVITISSFLSGAMIPLDLLPASVLNIVSLLPFKFITFIPASMLLDKQNFNIFQLLLEATIWIVILFTMNYVLYKKGVKSYESYGG